MATCCWCGEVYSDLNRLDHNENGFWCDMCEGFNFFNPTNYNKHRFLLLLEEDGGCETKSLSDGPKLRKRLSPLRYPGGKSKMIDYLYTRLSHEKLDVFVEVFAGGASLGLSLLDAGIIKRLILNDKDVGVYSFWKTVLSSPEELISKLRCSLPIQDDLAHAKTLLKNSQIPSSELAWAFLLANRLSYSGIIKAGPQGGKGGSQKDLLSRWNPKLLEKQIIHIYSMRNSIEVYNQDACTFLEENAYWNNKCTCFIDPPYYKKGKDLYSCYYNDKDHANLASLLQSLYMEFPSSDLIVTYDNAPFIRDLYPVAQQECVSRRYSI